VSLGEIVVVDLIALKLAKAVSSLRYALKTHNFGKEGMTFWEGG
jgi:hypothetical protein